jgi:hypothetical protein
MYFDMSMTIALDGLDYVFFMSWDDDTDWLNLVEAGVCAV